MALPPSHHASLHRRTGEPLMGWARAPHPAPHAFLHIGQSPDPATSLMSRAERPRPLRVGPAVNKVVASPAGSSQGAAAEFGGRLNPVRNRLLLYTHMMLPSSLKPCISSACPVLFAILPRVQSGDHGRVARWHTGAGDGMLYDTCVSAARWLPCGPTREHVHCSHGTTMPSRPDCEFLFKFARLFPTIFPGLCIFCLYPISSKNMCAVRFVHQWFTSL